MSSKAQYALDNAWDKARERLSGLESMADPGTIRNFERLGVDTGWNCLEAGAGGGSMTAWLADRVGPEGEVLAIDLDTRFVESLPHPNLSVRKMDLLADDLPSKTFDLVHTRALLIHLPDPQSTIQKLTETLAPGGWLLVEEMDFVSAAAVPGVDASQADLFEKVVHAHNRVLAERGDPWYGRRAADDLRDCQLESVDAEGRTIIVRGDTPGATAWRLTFEQLADRILELELATDAELDAVQHVLQDPDFAFQSMVFMAAWGRKPAA